MQSIFTILYSDSNDETAVNVFIRLGTVNPIKQTEIGHEKQMKKLNNDEPMTNLAILIGVMSFNGSSLFSI